MAQTDEVAEVFGKFLSELQRELDSYGLSSLKAVVEDPVEAGWLPCVKLYQTAGGEKLFLCEFYQPFWPSREVAHFLRGLLGERYPEAETPSGYPYAESFVEYARMQLESKGVVVAGEVIDGRAYVTVDGLRDVFGQGDSVHAPYFLWRGLEARAKAGI